MGARLNSKPLKGGENVLQKVMLSHVVRPELCGLPLCETLYFAEEMA